MIKFFRKIRRGLLTESKFRKYLLYAIGEIILVVIGILIALQISDWNEIQKQDKAEQAFFNSVKQDLQQDKAFINLIKDLMEPRIEIYKTLESDLEHLYYNDRESLDSIFMLYFNAQRTFYPLSGSYESAVAGNKINAFRNKELLQKVVKLYNSTYTRLIENGIFLDERWAFLSKKYSRERRTGHFRDMTPAELTQFLDDVYHHYIQMEWYYSQLKMAGAEIDKIST